MTDRLGKPCSEKEEIMEAGIFEEEDD